MRASTSRLSNHCLAARAAPRAAETSGHLIVRGRHDRNSKGQEAGRELCRDPGHAAAVTVELGLVFQSSEFSLATA